MLDLVMSILASMAIRLVSMAVRLVSMAMGLVSMAVRLVSMAVRLVSMAVRLVVLGMSRMSIFPSMLLGSETNGKTSAKTKLLAEVSTSYSASNGRCTQGASSSEGD